MTPAYRRVARRRSGRVSPLRSGQVSQLRSGQFSPLRSARGQSIVEFAIILPFILLICLGVVETSYALIDQHVVTKLAREGSNLISRNTTLERAGTVITSMSTAPVNFNNGTSTVLFSVLHKGAATGTANYRQVVLFQFKQFGTFPATSRLITGSGSFGGPPEYLAANPDTNTGLRVTSLSDDIINVDGGFLYVTEIFTRHNLITPLDRLLPYGVRLPNELYSIAYF